MEILQSVLILILTLGILVSIHEYGHFWVARRCGVKVLRFSVGFGKALYTKCESEAISLGFNQLYLESTPDFKEAVGLSLLNATKVEFEKKSYRKDIGFDL